MPQKLAKPAATKIPCIPCDEILCMIMDNAGGHGTPRVIGGKCIKEN
jgi:hypothetical protein